jgi:hypothetical protein
MVQETAKLPSQVQFCIPIAVNEGSCPAFFSAFGVVSVTDFDHSDRHVVNDFLFPLE